MISLEDMKIYLPPYLSSSSEKELFDNLKNLSFNERSLYANLNNDPNTIFQGDCIKNLFVVNLPDTKIEKFPNCMILSNTCDIDISNPRKFFSPMILYAPVFNLEKYITKLKTIRTSIEVDNHIKAIKEQIITQILYLPKYQNLPESIVFLDRINNCDNGFIERENINSLRVFSLSNTGFYLLLIKLSIHFTRIKEGIDRK